MSEKVKKNNGEAQQYYIEGNYELIIPPESFDVVQILIAKGKTKETVKVVCVIAGRIICGDCGSVFGSNVWHSNDKYHRVVWQCNKKFENKKKCGTPHFKKKN